jgi:type VI secretion system secreted protein VgrG
MSAREAFKPRYFFETAALDPDTLQVVDFVGHDVISQLFSFDLNLVSEDPEIDFADVINKPANLTMMRDDEETKIHGLIADFQQGGRTADWVAYRVTLVPRVWLLSLYYQSRVFQNMTVEDIVTKVLEDAGFTSDDFRFALSGSFTPREYCVQYRETDINFISRLLEHEGISFFFDHGDEHETMVITDDRSENPMIEDESIISYKPGAGMVPEEEAETVGEFICRERIVTGKVVLKDYNYLTPETNLKSESQLNSDMPGQYYEYGEHFKDTSEGDNLAKIRNEEIECTRRVITGASNCVAFRSGFLFSLEKHYRDDLNGDYLITHLTHYGSQGAGYATPMGGEAPTYKNEFSCIPADVSYRPPRLSPEACIPGIMTAKVETAGGDYAYIDEMGRYRVKMPFDLSDEGDGKASRPVRMAEPYSGPNYGIHFPNHANTEMVWACIDGNVDRPLGLSTVPNPSNTSPSVAENKPQSVIRTAGQNELTMDDTIGSENIYLHGTKDWTIEIVNDKNQVVGHDETLEVGNDQTKSIGANKMISVGGNHTEAISGNMDQTVRSAKTESIAIVKALTIGAAYQVSVGAAMNETVGAAKAEEIGAAKTVSVGASSSESIGANKSVDAGNNITIQAGKNYSCEAGENGDLKIGKKTKIQSGDDLTISGQKKGVIDIKDQLTIKCGKASIILKKNGDIQIKGNKINVKASSNLKMKGSKIAEN